MLEIRCGQDSATARSARAKLAGGGVSFEFFSPNPRQENEPMTDVSKTAPEMLRWLVERIERLEEEKKSLSDDISEIYSEAKSSGFDIKVLRQVIRQRRIDARELEEQETILDLYKQALGMKLPEFVD
jgi:uncharacterized protein (UPF0335 family)